MLSLSFFVFLSFLSLLPHFPLSLFLSLFLFLFLNLVAQFHHSPTYIIHSHKDRQIFTMIYSIYQYRRYVIFWPSTRPKNAIPRWCTGRKWHIPMASNRKRSRGQIKAYNMGQGEGPTVPLQWCTGREWPVNCMTIISAWWRLNIRFQRSSGRSCGRWIII